MIADEKISEIRERSSIVEVISDHLTLRKAGRNHVGLCPFHAEKTPSFTVNEEKGIFHCFGCGVGGNVFNFLMHYNHVSFPEAVEWLGRRYGIVVERSDPPGGRGTVDAKEPLYRLNERAAAYFHDVLFGHPQGKRALEYLKMRGIEDEIAQRFYLGYAPAGGQGLAGFFRKEGLSLEDAVLLGLLSEKGPGRHGEKFFDRLIFPIVNPGGKVVGFGGRVIGEGVPKYLNSAETPLFHKGSNLYGLFQAKEAVRTADRIVVVEGYLDVVALSQAGISYAVATLGTALTPSQVRVLGRYAKNVIVLFDGDEAGRKAAARSFEVFVESGLLGRAAFLPRGEDPDSFVRSEGRSALERIIDQAVPLADYYFTHLEEEYGKSLEGKSRVAQEVSRVLAKVQSPFEFELLTRRAADSLGIREEMLRRFAAGRKISHSPGHDRLQQGPRVQNREDLAESSLVTLMLRFPSVVRRVDQVTELERLMSPKWNGIFQEILSEWRARGQVDAVGLTDGLSLEQASQITALMLEGEDIPETESEKMMQDCLAHLQRRYLGGLEAELRQAIRVAEEKKDEKVKKERMLEWQEVVEKKRHLERQTLGSKTESR